MILVVRMGWGFGWGVFRGEGCYVPTERFVVGAEEV